MMDNKPGVINAGMSTIQILKIATGILFLAGSLLVIITAVADK